ncbi:hypothetical protein SD71_13680 [Cohnella kolymensis]|uniref:Glycosyltransferase RgtA/B/C/D-like domain-containing protein n=1 Tax=Cohnella kolymensis TaxID=1590652 RepID=A0ABR5A2V1_9BACL|nr:hypothetical protein [Cohnella kolymensis]KIL35370.1 hypothetical protein SD71_13680 [Cohnella kolymensis]
MLKSNKIRISALFIFIVIAITLLIYVPTAIGLADNSDFNRTMRAFGLTSISGLKYFSAEYGYKISNPTTIVQYFINMFLPVTDNPAGYYSTQFIFIKIALFFNALANKLVQRDPSLFNMLFQTVQFIIIYAFALVLFLKEKWKNNTYSNIAVKIVFAFIFFRLWLFGLLQLFFLENQLHLFFLILSFVLLLYLEKDKHSYFVYLGLILSLFIFSGSKPANFPSTLLLSVPLAYYAIKNEGMRKKIIICVSVVVMLFASYNYVKQAPEWMKNVTTFQAVFFGVLYNNPMPEQATKDLGLPPELSKVESINAYVEHPLNPYNNFDSDFQSLFFDRISKIEVLKYYLTHPAFFAEKLDVSAEAALPLRPTYLTNINLSNERADLLFDFRMNVWESIRKRFSGFASVFLSIVLALTLVNLIALFRKKASLYSILLRLALLGAAAGQFIIPIVSNGNADLQKHMFLFNVHLDILIFLLVLDNLDFRSRTFRRIGIAPCLF